MRRLGSRTRRAAAAGDSRAGAAATFDCSPDPAPRLADCSAASRMSSASRAQRRAARRVVLRAAATLKMVMVCAALVSAAEASILSQIADSFSRLSGATAGSHSVAARSPEPSAGSNKLSQAAGESAQSAADAAAVQTQASSVQAALLSSRGSLAMWRPADGLLEAAISAPDQQPAPSPSAEILAPSPSARANKWPQSQPLNRCLVNRQLTANARNTKYLSPQKRLGHANQPARELDLAALVGDQPPVVELLVVEGASLKLNLAVVSHRFSASPQPGAKQRQSTRRLRISWTRGGHPVTRNADRGTRTKFSQIVINESDFIRQYFAGKSQMPNETRAHKSTDENPIEGDELSRFRFAPHVNELHLSRYLESAGSSERRPIDLRRLLTNYRHLRTSANQFEVGEREIDSLVGDGLAIDWQRLESYLSSNADKLRLFMPSKQSIAKDAGSEASSSSQDRECRDELAAALSQIAASIDHFLVLQVELSSVGLGEQGLYELHVCREDTDAEPADEPSDFIASSINSTSLEDELTGGASCAQVRAAFRLHVLEDVPKFELRPEAQVLSQGERMSVKCEATGYTLPQITWFSNGQQLNEHQLGGNRHSAHQLLDSQMTSNNNNLLSGGTHLRIGDYVSQDNHVHSFVNSSQVQLTDSGFYKCQANNGFHSIEHEIRVDVRGPPVIARHLNNLSALVGTSQLQIQCPFGGFPIHSVEWYYRPHQIGGHSEVHARSYAQDLASIGYQKRHVAELDEDALRTSESNRDPSTTPTRLRRVPAASDPRRPPLASNLLVDGENPTDPDPDKDDWLSQAQAMTPSGPEDYPEPIPDYSGMGVAVGRAQAVAVADYAELEADSLLDDDATSGLAADYSDIEMDSVARRRRSTGGGQPAGDWAKLPQSRRHQVHVNGTLLIQDVSRGDQGYYRCRALQLRSTGGELLAQQLPVGTDSAGEIANYESAQSNEFHLNILVPPIISPITSADSLREGMRNFLTCSVIEGDSPLRLSWLKNGSPIEDYIQQQQQHPARIRVDTTNEFTSTLYFSHVDFRDNGNYTCIAANKAASVNYTTRMLVNVPPKWTRPPKDVECTAGQSITIDCQAQAYPNPRIWWEVGVYPTPPSSTSAESSTVAPVSSDQNSLPAKFNETTAGGSKHNPLSTTPNHYRTIISNSRIHTLENASLVIRDVTKLDQGYYLCQAANNFGSLSSLIKLTVNVGASFANKFQVKYVKLNDRVELDCDPIGQAPVSVTWFMRQHEQSQSANSSTVQRHSHSLDSLGRRLFTASIQTDIHHHAKPSPQTLLTAQQVSTTSLQPHQEQQELNLHQSSSMSFELLRRLDAGQSEFIRLSVKQAKRYHSAEFTCQAANQFGGDEKVIKLLVQEPPDPIHEINHVRVESRSVSISWPPPYNGNSPIISYLVEWSPVGSRMDGDNKWSQMIVQQTAATISRLTPLTTYEFRIRATNQMGQSGLVASIGHLQPSTMVITTSEEAPNFPPRDIKVTSLSSSSLQVAWSPPISSHQPSDQSSPRQQPAKISRSSPQGYYVGYKVIGSNESFLFKTVSSLDAQLASLNSVDDDFNKSDTSEQKIDRSRIQVVISELKRSTKYLITVQAFNSAGAGPQSDQIEAKTLANDPPPTPQLRVGMVTYTSIELLWSFILPEAVLDSQLHMSLVPAENSIEYPKPKFMALEQPSVAKPSEVATPKDITVDGYQLFYKSMASSSWSEKRLTSETHKILATNHLRNDLSIVDKNDDPSTAIEDRMKPSALVDVKQQTTHLTWHKNSTGPLIYKKFRFTLGQLQCGNSYQIYLIAFNSIGSSIPSQILRTKTRGSAPVAPRKQDFIILNSTYVRFNLDSWLDQQCTMKNFEIRYRQMDSRGNSNGQSDTSSDSWLLLSDNINPEQRIVELPGLKSETWYSVLVGAESIAGKTEAQFNFMTLDRFGNLPAEAMEASNLPSLFRSNGSIRSMLNNFALANHSPLSPLILSACLCLVILATCSLFLIKRYNNVIKDDASIDSRTTTGAMSNSHYNGDGENYKNFARGLSSRAHHHQHHGEHANDNPSPYSSNQEHYLMKVSPCKTATTTILTNSSDGSNNSSNAHQCHLASAINNRTLDYSGQSVSRNQGIEFYRPANCAGNHEPDSCLAGKFASLSRGGDINFMQANRFKTMPHQHHQRPVSTFLPSSPPLNMNNASAQGVQLPASAGRFVFKNIDEDNNNSELNLLDHQQIYSKLRLLCNTNNSYNLCPELQTKTQGCDLYDVDALNLALFAHNQQQGQVQTSSKGGGPSQYGTNNLRPDSQQDQAEAAINSLLSACHPQDLNTSTTTDNLLEKLQSSYQQHQLDQTNLLVSDLNAPATYTTDGYGSASIVTESMSNQSNASAPTQLSCQSNTATQSLISSSSTTNSGRSNNLMSSEQVLMQKRAQSASEGSNGQLQPEQQHHGEYALPSPPKWV